MIGSLVKQPKLTACLLAVVLYFLSLSDYLPFGNDLTLAVGWLGLGGQDAVASPIWGELVRFSMAHLPGSVAFRLGVVSATCASLSVLLFSYAVECFLSIASAKAESKAVILELRYELPVRLGVLLSSLAFIFTPPLFLAATRTGPLMSQIMIVMAGFAALGLATNASSGLFRTYLIVLAGFFASLGGFEGVPGILAYPFLLLVACLASVRGVHRISSAIGIFVFGSLVGWLFAMGDALSVDYVIRSLSALVHQLPFGLLFPGSVILLITVILPLFVLYKLIVTKRLVRLAVRRIYFGIWAFVVAGMAVAVFASNPSGRGKAADRFVDRALEKLGDRTWLLSDGTFDDLLLLKKPEGVRLVTLRREHDLRHGEELLKWSRESLNANDDLCLAAELGPVKFMSQWFTTDAGAGTNILALTVREPRFGGKTPLPRVFGWDWDAADRSVAELAEDWNGAWAEFGPWLASDSEPGAAWLKRWFSIQGVTVGAMAAAAKDQPLAWKTLLKVQNEVYPANLSAILNLVGLLDGGYKPGIAEQDQIRSLFKVRMDAIRSQDHMKWELAMGGRIFVNPELREKVSKWREQMRQNVWETPSGKRLKATLDNLSGLEHLEGKARAEALAKIENTDIPSLRASKCAAWVKGLTLAEFYMQKGDRESLITARDLFRSVLENGVGEVRLAYDRILDANLALRDMEGLEYDALLVLRHDVRHQIANALLGSMRLEKREYASAERFLRRAISLGTTQPGMQNDLALALSGLGRHDEAIEMIAGLVEKYPLQWNLLDTQASVLRAAGRKAEANAAQNRAREVAREVGQVREYQQMRKASGGMR